MEFKKLIEERRSVRKYSGIPSHEELAAILDDARMAPSWKNQQTARKYVVESPEKLAEFKEKCLPVFNANSAAGAAIIVTTFVKDVVGFDTDGQPTNEVGNKWGAYDLGLHDAYLLLAAKNAGYDTLIMGIRDAKAIRTMLEIPANEVIMSVIAIGKRDQEPALRPRKELQETVRFF